MLKLLKSLIQTYTISVFWLGIAVAAILRFGFHDETEPLLGVFYTQFLGWDVILDNNFDRLRLITIPGLMGLGIMWVSSRLDFVEPGRDYFQPLAKKSVTGVLLVWVLALFMTLGHGLTVELHDYPWFAPGAHWMEVPLGLMTSIISILVVVLLLPFSALWWIFPVVCLGWIIGGVLSLMRAITFVLTRHKLRDTYRQGQRRASFNAKEVARHLGGKSTSQAHARALLKDSVNLLSETKSRAATLNKDLDGLSQKAQDDVQRLKVEAELSEMLAEIEATKIKIDALKKRAGERHGK